MDMEGLVVLVSPRCAWFENRCVGLVTLWLSAGYFVGAVPPSWSLLRCASVRLRERTLCVRRTYLQSTPIGVVGAGIDVLTSTIEGAGLGLFATKAYRRNDLVSEYEGELVASRKHAAALKVQTHIINFEGVRIDGIRDAMVGMGGASFCNHPLDPSRPDLAANAKICQPGTASFMNRLFLKATRDISIGEEVFWKYGRIGGRFAFGDQRLEKNVTSSGDTYLTTVRQPGRNAEAGRKSVPRVHPRRRRVGKPLRRGAAGGPSGGP